MPCNRFIFPDHEHMSERHRLLPDEAFVRAFTACTLEPGLFSHEAHLRLAWILITRHGLMKASEMLCRLLKEYDRVYGDGTKFDSDLTLAAARTVDRFQKRSRSASFTDFLKDNPCLLEKFREQLNVQPDN